MQSAELWNFFGAECERCLGASCCTYILLCQLSPPSFQQSMLTKQPSDHDTLTTCKSLTSHAVHTEGAQLKMRRARQLGRLEGADPLGGRRAASNWATCERHEKGGKTTKPCPAQLRRGWELRLNWLCSKTSSFE